jgi:hypothetical protein
LIFRFNTVVRSSKDNPHAGVHRDFRSRSVLVCSGTALLRQAPQRGGELTTRLRVACWVLAAGIAATVDAAPAPLMTVLIKPGRMSQTAGTGDVEVLLTLPEVHVPAGAALLRLGTMVPGMSKPQPVSELVVSDTQGAAPVVLHLEEGNCEWTTTRALEGELKVRYHLPLENIPLVRGGPPIQLRIDGDGFSGVGNMLVAIPLIQSPYRIEIQWDLAAMGPGAAGVTSYGDGNVMLPEGPIARIASSLFMAGHLQRSPEKPAVRSSSRHAMDCRAASLDEPLFQGSNRAAVPCFPALQPDERGGRCSADAFLPGHLRHRRHG